MRLKHLTYVMAGIMMMAACEKNPEGPSGQKPEPQEPEQTETVFAKGADISWVTQMEADGQKFYSQDGRETECTALMKELGFNAIRLRVWVNPEGGWCGSEDVLVKARRAQALGMRIMIDFHYSDTWADPSKQVVPAAWSGYGTDALTEAVAAHTGEVLQLLKDNGVEVEWVQIGNEINDGMLHPHGKLSDPQKIGNFTGFFNAGSAAARRIYPDIKVVLHRSNGHETTAFEWLLDTMKYKNLDYDIIGMSLYPTWWENGGWRSWKSAAEACMANIAAFHKKYGKPVIICEIGMPVSEPEMSQEALRYVLENTSESQDCQGVFYWEPQTDGVWKPSSYAALGWNAYDKGAFHNGKATSALDPFKE